jgi:two-component sensor histidine kinase
MVMAIGRLITRRAAEDRRVLEWLSRQSAIRNSLTRELNHRVKNTLANVLSIAALTRRRSSNIDEFTESLTARIRALSATHDLLSQSDWGNAPLGEIIRSELAPYMDGGDSHVRMAGPEIKLAPNDAMSLGLAIHELATNAAKYGALSTTTGQVHVTWTLEGPDKAEIRWREEGGPTVSEPTKRGFGRDLIEKIVAHELRSQVDLQFFPEGVQCRLTVPVRESREFLLRSDHPPR